MVYACDFSQRGAALGAETISRLLHLHELEKAFQIAGLIMSAGFHPDPQAYPEQRKSFGAMMHKWVRNNTSIPDEAIYTDRPVWGTVGETYGAVRIIEEEGLPADVHIVTSDYHVMRVKMCWFLYSFGKKYRKTFHGTKWDKPPTKCAELKRTAGAFLKILLGKHGYTYSANT